MAPQDPRPGLARLSPVLAVDAADDGHQRTLAGPQAAARLSHPRAPHVRHRGPAAGEYRHRSPDTAERRRHRLVAQPHRALVGAAVLRAFHGFQSMPVGGHTRPADAPAAQARRARGGGAGSAAAHSVAQPAHAHRPGREDHRVSATLFGLQRGAASALAVDRPPGFGRALLRRLFRTGPVARGRGLVRLLPMACTSTRRKPRAPADRKLARRAASHLESASPDCR